MSTQSTHYHRAGAVEVRNALIAEGFPEDYAAMATRNTVPADDHPGYLGWTKHLPEARAYALGRMRSHAETLEFNAAQLRRQAGNAMAERAILLAKVAVLSAPPPGARDGGG